MGGRSSEGGRSSLAAPRWWSHISHRSAAGQWFPSSIDATRSTRASRCAALRLPRMIDASASTAPSRFASGPAAEAPSLLLLLRTLVRQRAPHCA